MKSMNLGTSGVSLTWMGFLATYGVNVYLRAAGESSKSEKGLALLDLSLGDLIDVLFFFMLSLIGTAAVFVLRSVSNTVLLSAKP